MKLTVRLLLIGLTILSGRSIRAQEWQATTEELIRTEKPGYGGLCGVLVDHQSGDIIVNVSDRGFYRSTDQGKTWKRIGSEIKGRTEWPGCLQLDPTGKSKTLMSALVYGSPIVIGSESEKWSALNPKSSHVDWAAIDWTDTERKFVLTLKHESGDLLIVSRDGGKSFSDVGKGYGPAWVFDNETAVVAEVKSKTKPMPGLLRTTDGGKTFKPIAVYSTKALPKWRDGTLYWLVDGAIITTTDKGETWKKQCDLKDGRYGPIFGKDAKQLFVLTGAGIVESGDGGASWSKPVALPKAMKGVSPLTWLEYDPVHDVLYTMKMTSDLYKMPRGK
jgi:photosystem II stability/assembly factor-like uncharacterized protein